MGTGTETEILQKNMVTFVELFLKPSDTIGVLGTLTTKYRRQLLIMSMLVVLNNFTRKWTI